MSKFIIKAEPLPPVITIEHLPSITEIQTDANKLRAMLTPLDLQHLFLWDYYYYYCPHEDWGKVFEKVLLNMPEYTAEKFDCSNFALLTSVRTSELFKLNTCGIAIGQSPFGYHGFCLFLSSVDNEDRLFILDPQNGMIYPIEEPEGYKPEILIMG